MGLNLRGKLVLLIVAITAISLVGATAVQILYQRAVAKERLTGEQRMVAELLADRSTAALSFSDQRVAQENIAAARVHDRIVQVCIYDAGGSLFAAYSRQPQARSPCPVASPGRPPGISDGELFGVQPIRIEGEQIGTLTILTSLDILSQRTYRDVTVALLILIGAVMLALLAAVRLQRLISAPILDLAAAAAYITRTRDYVVRAESTTPDEVGRMVRSFNAMLDVIQARDASLRASIDELNSEVERRKAAETAASKALADLQQAFERSLQVEKLSALGTFVGGIAHEINNPLMGLSNFIDYVREKTSDPEQAEVLGLAQDQVRRIGRIVDRVLRYSRSGDGVFRPIDLEQLVVDAQLLLKSELDHAGVDVQVGVCEDLPQVVGDKDVLDQSLVNLLLNAIDAVKGRPERQIRIRLRKVAGGAEVSIADTGAAVPDSIRSRIYDPFFTTKPPGEGTGLGLSVTIRGLSEVGASLELDEDYQEGARFVLFVPDRPPAAGVRRQEAGALQYPCA